MLIAQGTKMRLDTPAAYASCCRAPGRLAHSYACRDAARIDAACSSPVMRLACLRGVTASSMLAGSGHRNWHERAACRQRAARGVVAASGGPSDVFILDFDGVLVDSEPEVSMAGFHAAKEFWPGIVTDAEKDQVLEGLRVTRPVLVSGWETVIMARIFAEDPDAAPKILHDWPAVMSTSLRAWGTDLSELRRVFEEERNAWVDNEEEEWLGLVQPYQNVVSTLKYTELPFYIASSKAPHRVSRVAEKQLGLNLPVDSPRLFAGLIPPSKRKAEALREIAKRPLVSEGGAKMHFIDDRLETARDIAADAGLRDAGLRVYFAEWGYSTPQEKMEAQQLAPYVTSITLPQMNELVKWGILMGVDDGCGDDN